MTIPTDQDLDDLVDSIVAEFESKLSSEWRPCVKLPITVYVREQRPGETHVSTREGITPVRPDDLIMRGVEGEEYPIGRELFQKTYRLLPSLLSSAIAVLALLSPLSAVAQVRCNSSYAGVTRCSDSFGGSYRINNSTGTVHGNGPSGQPVYGRINSSGTFSGTYGNRTVTCNRFGCY